MTSTNPLPNAFSAAPEPCEPIETRYRRIATALPAPETIEVLQRWMRVFPEVNCYLPPIVWDRAEGFQVFDAAGNRWIDFSSTAVMANTGHGHPAIRGALSEHVEQGLLAQFAFASEIRVELAEKLLELAPPHCDKVYFWTVGSEASEASLRCARLWGMKQDPEKHHIVAFRGDYHGWTLGAHQVSGESAKKPWLAHPDAAIHHLPFPRTPIGQHDDTDWERFFDESITELQQQVGIDASQIAGVFVETLQGWCAAPLPLAYVKRLRAWADEHNVLLIFDEIQTGFGRTGRLFGHEHYGIRADLLCIAKGLTSTLPLSAVLGPAEVIDQLSPGEVTTTHAAHPLSCAAALANLRALEEGDLIAEADRKGEIAERELKELQTRHPNHIAGISGLGLLRAIHVRDPHTGQPSRELARDWTWASVKRGVMLFQTNQPTLKVCPPLVIEDDALVEGIRTLGDALSDVVVR